MRVTRPIPPIFFVFVGVGLILFWWLFRTSLSVEDSTEALPGGREVTSQSDHLVVTDTTAAQPVEIAVYYEALCPDSVQFVLNQLTPVYEKLKDWIHIDLVPFGKARVSTFNIFIMQI